MPLEPRSNSNCKAFVQPPSTDLTLTKTSPTQMSARGPRWEENRNGKYQDWRRKEHHVSEMLLLQKKNIPPVSLSNGSGLESLLLGEKNVCSCGEQSSINVRTNNQVFRSRGNEIPGSSRRCSQISEQLWVLVLWGRDHFPEGLKRNVA